MFVVPESSEPKSMNGLILGGKLVWVLWEVFASGGMVAGANGFSGLRGLIMGTGDEDEGRVWWGGCNEVSKVFISFRIELYCLFNISDQVRSCCLLFSMNIPFTIVLMLSFIFFISCNLVFSATDMVNQGWIWWE